MKNMKNIYNLYNDKNILSYFFKNKAGIYQLKNLKNGKIYVGSSAMLSRRFNEYLNISYINRNLERGNSHILKALFKYGYVSFEVTILELIEFKTNQSK